MLFIEYKLDDMIKNIHIGILIQEVLKEQKITVANFAKELGRDRSSVYDMFKRQSIDTGTLSRISEILNYNFFFEYSYRDAGDRTAIIY
jgi:predicted transcriptional regulator